ncbi:hypothetical protein ACAG26_07755 [Mycobacterium sp. pUA109]|uniref:hypothetical protein n=1 Tax=Mycobacterium sp. pUA109 TaxID=3238982 RepID=UPI00351B965E
MVIAPAVVAVIAMAPFAAMMSDNFGRDTPPLAGLLVVAAVFLPPSAAAGVYVAGAMRAYYSSGLTFYYPWIALAVGAAAWAGIGGSISRWLTHLQWASRRDREPPAATLVVPEGWDGKPRTGEQALVALEQWALRHTGGTPSALNSMRADRFESGWVISVPPPTTRRNRRSKPDPPRYRPIFLVGDSGRITEVGFGPLQEACRQFAADEAQRND